MKKFLPTTIGFAIGFWFCFMLSTTYIAYMVDDMRAQVKSTVTKEIRDSLIQKVRIDKDQDFIGVVTYSDELSWHRIEFINYNIFNGLVDSKEKTLTVQLNTRYKVGQRFYIVPEQ